MREKMETILQGHRHARTGKYIVKKIEFGQEVTPEGVVRFYTLPVPKYVVEKVVCGGAHPYGKEIAVTPELVEELVKHFARAKVFRL